MSPGAVGQIFLVYLRLGLTSFGGPMVHFVMFRREFVERRSWVSEREFAQLLTMSQFLPGPGSSKLGFAIGLLRGGWPGALAAFVAFTLPSALLLFAFAALLPALSGATGQALLHGLKLVALAVVAFGLSGMIRSLCPDTVRRALAALAAVVVLLLGQGWAQLLAMAVGAAGGARWCRGVHPDFSGTLSVRYGSRAGAWLLAGFLVLLVGLPWAAHASARDAVRYAAAFFHTGAMAFGGGHVALPLLEQAVVEPGWVSTADFMAGYGAAQAVPGPMFALSAYLGARLPGPDGGWLGAVLAMAGTFVPGFLLTAGLLPYWSRMAAHPGAARAIAGVSAAVVGLIAAALYDPVWTSAVRGPADVAVAALAILAMAKWRAPALAVVAWCVLASLAMHWAGIK